jgi:hypothetical protein
MKGISLVGTALATVAAALFVLALTSPASLGAAAKAKAKPDCPKNALCLWDKENYEGFRVVVRGKGVSNKVFDEMNDLTSSVFLNRKNRIAVLYQDTDGGGGSICLYEDNRWRINKIGAPFDDAISSTQLKKNLPPSCIL